MPAPVFSTLNDLLNHIQTEIGPNGTNAITGQKHRDVLLSVAQSLLQIVDSLPGSTVNSFESWSGSTTYTGGEELVVRHNDKLWLFISSTDVVGTEPGTNGLVWQQISAVQLAHFRNQDQYLDFGGPSQVSASAIRRSLAQRTAWLQPIDEISYEPLGIEPIGWVVAVADGAIGEFAGYDGQLAELTLSGWDFYATSDGATLRYRNDRTLVMRIAGAWLEAETGTPSLANVLATSNATGSFGIRMQRPMVEEWTSVSHNSAGDLYLDLGTSGPCLFVNVNADVTLRYNTGSVGPAVHYVILTGVGSTRNITWPGSTWYKSAGVTLPTTIAAGQRYLMHIRRNPLVAPVIMSMEAISVV